MRKKRYVSLLEIMIVILLIGIITSVVGYNVKGSLEKGKVFQTQQSMKQIKDILSLEIAQGEPVDEVIKDSIEYLKRSGLAKNAEKLVLDGWKEKFEIGFDKKKNKVMVTSKKYQEYVKKHKLSKDRLNDEEDD